MTKIELGPIEEAVRENARLRDEIAMLREVNAAQADRIAYHQAELAEADDDWERIKAQNDELREQLRKAQERIRAAEAERDRAWNEAIEACAETIDADAEGEFGRGTGEVMMRIYLREKAATIRSLAKEAGE